MTTRELALIGVPSSMGAYAPGQEKAPGALRAAGLPELLREAGVAVDDRGDAVVRRWRPDRRRPHAQNLTEVVEVVRETGWRVSASTAPALVLGGDCTVGLGTLAGHADGQLGLVYFDLHADLNVPRSVPDGALDWMGMAHLLREEGAEPELSAPLPEIDPSQIVLFSYRADQLTPHELGRLERLPLNRIAYEEVAREPEAAARAALDSIEARCERLVIHFDVDVIDFTDAPLSENTGRNLGLSLDSAMRAVSVLAGSERLGALSVTELNPDHGEPDGSTVRDFAERLASALA